MKESEDFDLEEHFPAISDIITNQHYLTKFQEAMEGEEVIVLDNIDHPHYDMDYEQHLSILELCEIGIITRSDLFNFVKNNVRDFSSFRFEDGSLNRQAPLIGLIEILSNNPEETDQDTYNIMHFIQAKHAVIGNTEDPASCSDWILGDQLQCV
jgi:hypothetical protein